MLQKQMLTKKSFFFFTENTLKNILTEIKLVHNVSLVHNKKQ